MIRGVNKNVIEISDTGNDCFERAILFVRQSCETHDKEHLHRHAISFLSGLHMRPGFYTKGRLLRAALKLGSAAAVGAAVTAFLLR